MRREGDFFRVHANCALIYLNICIGTSYADPAFPLVDHRKLSFMARTRRILVVDDDSDITELLGHLLKHKGYEIRIANDGLEAVHVAGEFRPDFVLVDVGMPGLDGFDTANRIRSEPWGGSITFIGISGHCGSQYEERARDAGFKEYLTKPIPIKTIIDVMARFSHEPDRDGSEPTVETLDPIRIKSALENAQRFICQLKESIAFNSYLQSEAKLRQQQTRNLLARITDLRKDSRDIVQL